MTRKANNTTLKPEFIPKTASTANTVTPVARAGEVCPVCKLGIMDYDGLLNLVCPVCGYTEGGCFT